MLYRVTNINISTPKKAEMANLRYYLTNNNTISTKRKKGYRPTEEDFNEHLHGLNIA